MPLTYKQVKKILDDLEFELSRSNWSHFRFEKRWFWLTVPFHKEFATKTAKSILNDISKISNCDYKDLVDKYKIKI